VTQLIAAAAAVDVVDYPNRTITGLIAPFGEPGRTNLGVRALRASAVRFFDPANPVVLGTYGHGDEWGAERGPIVARLIAHEYTPAGLRGTWKVAEGELGDRTLREADPRTGIRAGMSVELDDCTVDPWSGDIVEARPLEYVAFVPIGAYASARVDLVAAAHPTGTGDSFVSAPVNGGQLPQQQQQPAPQQQQYQLPQQPVYHQQQPAPAASGPPANGAPAPAPQPAGDLHASLSGLALLSQLFGQQPQQQAAPAPVPHAAGLPVSSMPQQPAQQPAQQQQPNPGQAPSAGPAGGAVRTLAGLRAAMHRGDDAAVGKLRAALADLVNAGGVTANGGNADSVGLELFQGPPGAIGQELWSGASYTRRFVPLFTPKVLTSWKFGGWRWVTKPKLSAYTGNKDEVGTSPVKVEYASGEAERLAGAWDIDRKFRDFGDSDFWAGFYAGQAESYLELSDQAAAAALAGFASDMSVDANRPAGYAGVTVDDSGTGMLATVALGNAMLEDTPNVRRTADFVGMNTGDWLALTRYTSLDLPAFLAMLGVSPDKFLRSSAFAAGQLTMGVRPAISFYELGGGSPIRVEALDVAHAGIDSGAYGYYGTLLNRPGGVISVPLPVAPEAP
jgi:hypothetical protein